jgi:uncharacterized protein YbjT (DUF2867 family)
MRILLTGASGFIGKNLLLQKPDTWDVVAIYRNPEFLEFVTRHHLNHITPVQCDLSDKSDVTRLA